MKSLYILVLAAGQGTRMKSATPKVLHTVAGRPLLDHVLRASQALNPKEIGVVLGVGRDQVKEAMQERGWKKLTFIVQDEPRGSGHAVLKARGWLRNKKGFLLVVYGDSPLLNPTTLRRLTDHHAASGNAATFLAMDLQNPTGYGRMMTNGEGSLERIVEEKDATPEQRAVTLVNAGVACWDIGLLLHVLPRLRPNNVKHEYYLTDCVALLRELRQRVGLVQVDDVNETYGVNTRIDLARAEKIMRRRILERWMLEGVTIMDPETAYIDAQAVLSPDSRIWPGTLIRGDSHVGSHCEIGPYTILESAIVKKGARVGPFARLRPGTVVEENARIGNFVEIKKAGIGKGAKVNHLSYIGDADVGDDVNIGAGTITCNYDGFFKFRTTLGRGVFVGSNTNLVAPVKVGHDAIIAAGSTITEDVPAHALALGRARQFVKEGWAKKFRETNKRKHHA